MIRGTRLTCWIYHQRYEIRKMFLKKTVFFDQKNGHIWSKNTKFDQNWSYIIILEPFETKRVDF